MNIIHDIKNPRRIALATAALIAALCAGAQAADVPQVDVKYADLNVYTTVGAAALYRRIRAAAEQVCTPLASDFAHVAQAKACQTRAIAEAVATINNPNLTKIHEDKTGGTRDTQLAASR
jgi:UrcA family protein